MSTIDFNDLPVGSFLLLLKKNYLRDGGEYEYEEEEKEEFILVLIIKICVHKLLLLLFVERNIFFEVSRFILCVCI